MPYMTGCTNYDTHAEAKKAFKELTAWTVLRLKNDGTARIDYLQSTPIQHGQNEYNISTSIEQNRPL